MNYSEWFDENGLLHHKKNPTTDTSENEILFTAEYLILSKKLGRKFEKDVRAWRMLKFYYDEQAAGRRISHDNKTAIISYYKSAIDDESIFKVGNRWWLHPRDIIMFGYSKYGNWFYPLLFIPSIAMIISCATTYKKHPDRKEITTSGKMLAWLRMQAFDMKLTFKICDWLIRRNPKFQTWTDISEMYFPEKGHPIPELMTEWEMRYLLSN